MAFSRLVFTVLLLSVSCYATNVPAFLWGNLAKSSAESNPLVTITTPEFSDILKEQLAEKPITVVFMEKTLSVEDLSRRDANGESSFPYLYANLGDSLYLPSVVNPVEALNELADPNQADRIRLTEDGLIAEIQSNSVEPKFLIINLEDAKEGESRAELLRRHNNFMQDTVEKLQIDYKKVIAIYTGRNPSWVIPEFHSRVRRQAENITNEDVHHLEGLLLYVNSLRIENGNSTTTLDGHPSSNTIVAEDKLTMNTTVTFGDNSFVMLFRQRAGYWFFDSIIFPDMSAEDDLRSYEEIYALNDFSYRCGQTVVFSGSVQNVTRSVVFEDIQIQPFFNKQTNETFGEPLDCVGYFSAPIWAGLMVTFLLLAITFFGIMMMMDIRTMDRFDDPKGKTITINTSE